MAKQETTKWETILTESVDSLGYTCIARGEPTLAQLAESRKVEPLKCLVFWALTRKPISSSLFRDIAHWGAWVA